MQSDQITPTMAHAADANYASLELSGAPERPCYLDYNATTPLRASVVAAMAPHMQPGLGGLFGNASSGHAYGQAAASALAHARGQVAACIGASDASREVVLLSGATEALNYALIGGARAQRTRGRGNHIIACTTEHIASLAICAHLEREENFVVTLLPVDSRGLVTPEQVAAAVRSDTVLVSLMLANNEVGTVLPIAEISKAVRAAQQSDQEIWIHTDASQALGKLAAVNVDDLGVDLLTIAGHKIYAPKGVGALYIRAASVGASGGLAKIVHGASHEADRRAGTENVLFAAGLGKACELAAAEGPTTFARFAELRDALQHAIESNLVTFKEEYHLSPRIIPDPEAGASLRYDWIIHGAEQRLPNTLSIGFHGVRASDLLRRLEHHLAASAGAACHTDSSHDVDHPPQLSHVLAAMGVPHAYGVGTLRLSVGRYTTLEEAKQCGRWVAQAVARAWCDARAAVQAT